MIPSPLLGGSLNCRQLMPMMAGAASYDRAGGHCRPNHDINMQRPRQLFET
jgi:hypothetical protein